jgi:CSLREA domain-containing protein
MARGDFSLERFHSRQPVLSFRVFLPILLLVSLTPGQNFILLQSTSAAPAAYPTYTVDSTLDTPDADTGNGICATAGGQCTLRAAIMQANSDITPVTIILPAGLYRLTRVGLDDNAFAGDLDISGDLAIQGSGPGVTIIDGNGAVTGDRVFHLLSGSQVSMVNLTIRDGNVMTGANGDGGGILIQGASLYLNNVAIEGNIASNGGGLAADSGQIQVHRSVIRANTAASSGGGFYANASAMTIQDSKVYSNTANSGGGLALTGIENGRIERTEIYSNTASLWGGGLDNEASLSGAIDKVTLEDSPLQNNGGSIPTQALLAGSPAIDAGDNGACPATELQQPTSPP